MHDDDLDLFGLFLALGQARVDEARAALSAKDEPRLFGALVPLAVDAALLGADGVAALARALAAPPTDASADDLSRALDALAHAVASLGHGDASGARTEEARLVELAVAIGHRAIEVPAQPSPKPAAAAPGADDTLWIPSLPEELVGAFLDECQERIEGLSSKLLEIEQEGVGAAGGEGIRALFRDLHTLKGSSGFAGLARLNRLAHASEDLVAKVRDGTAACDRPTIDVLLATVDRFRAIVERAAARAPIDVEVDDLVARLRDPRNAAAAQAGQVAQAGQAAQAGQKEAAHKPQATATLRVEFERVDQLQNFVNELVLARGRLSRAATSQLGLGRELARLRRQMNELVPPDRRDDPAVRALAAIVDELGRAERVVDEGGLEIEGSLGALGAALGQLRDRVMRLRMVPIARLFTKHQRTVRELGQALGKRVRLELRGQETELDKVLVEQLEDPLVHLVRNALDHGLEAPADRVARGKPEVGTLSLVARQQGGAIVVEVSDDGAGIDPARIRSKAVEKGVITAEEAASLDDRASLELVFRAGFSTAAAVTDVSGRGVGMDVVREAIGRLKGTIEIRSTVGVGTSFELRLPLTLAVAQVLLVRVGGEEVALPIDAVSRSLSRADSTAQSLIEDVGGRPCLVEVLEDETRRVPIVDLGATLGLEERAADGAARAVGGSARPGGHLVIVEAPLPGIAAVALEVDALRGRHDVVVKPLGALLTHAPCVAGASLLGDRVVVLLDVAAVARRGLEAAPPPRAALSQQGPQGPRKRVLVAEDADVVREALRHALEGAGLEVVAARDGAEALDHARSARFDLISTDVMMPRLDGYALTRALRAMPEYARTPIVMVSSKDQRVDVLRGYDAGVDAYVTKPADVHALLRTIEELLARGS
ncbi:MAG: response regulator [Deltaproteobacteria bacterium]|nr:response regulator [Deltaproteobacteria bacterium]